MVSTKRWFFSAAIALSLCTGLSAFAESGQTLNLRLTRAPMDASMRNAIAGSGTATATLNGSKLTIDGTFDGLVTPATGAQIRNGRATGVRGPTMLELTVTKAVAGKISGSFDLTPEQLENYRKHHLYIQIDSEKAQEGNLWAWMLP